MSGSKSKNSKSAGKDHKSGHEAKGTKDVKDSKGAHPAKDTKHAKRRQLLEEQKAAEAAERRRRTRNSIGLAAAAILVVGGIAVAISAVKGSSPASASPDAYSDPNTTPTPGSTTAAKIKPTSGAAGSIPAVSGGFGETPVIAKPVGDPPSTLVVKDLKEGSGDPVTDITTPYLWNYSGISWSTGETFDSSFESGQPATFALNEVIPGWTEGLQGIKPGGRRVLVIPAEQAYGATGRPGIAPNETLVFVVDLIGPAN